MEALGELSLIQRAEAEIQRYVAEFLGMKSRLIKLRENPSLQIRGKAAGLLTVQTQLENDLKAQLAKIEQMKTSGMFTLSDTLAIGAFAARLYKHINDVKDLEREVLVTTPGWQPESELVRMVRDWGLPVGLLMVGLVMIGYGVFSKR